MPFDAAPLPWDELFEHASAQAGHFTRQQALDLGFSEQLLAYHHRTGRFLRPFTGVYRFARYPGSEHEDLAVAWLASAREGVFSHETALALHDLSDVLPARLHMTLPSAWRRRKLPAAIDRHYAHVPAQDTVWVGPVRVTSVARTLRDAAAVHVAPDLLIQAHRQARARGLLPGAQQLTLAAE